jgi:hypothetical protein
MKTIDRGQELMSGANSSQETVSHRSILPFSRPSTLELSTDKFPNRISSSKSEKIGMMDKLHRRIQFIRLNIKKDYFTQEESQILATISTQQLRKIKSRAKLCTLIYEIVSYNEKPIINLEVSLNKQTDGFNHWERRTPQTPATLHNTLNELRLASMFNNKFTPVERIDPIEFSLNPVQLPKKSS